MLTIQIGMKSLKAAEAELKAASTVGISIRVKKFHAYNNNHQEITFIFNPIKVNESLVNHLIR